jgi:hypothetical protein
LLYNHQPTTAFCVEKAACYVDQSDLNIPLLTVKETLHFSEACLGRWGGAARSCCEHPPDLPCNTACTGRAYLVR